jgi:hypothetical protein
MMRSRLRLTGEEFDHLRALQVAKRWDWPAAFSTNSKGDIWPYVEHGPTRAAGREEVSGISRVIDELANLYRKERAEGGRFFIDDRGACYKGDEVGGPLNLFVLFEIEN